MPLANKTIYINKTKNANSGITIKNINDFHEANSLQNLIGSNMVNNTMNVTMQGGTRSNFFIAKD